MKLVENEFIKFMEKFNANPFRIIWGAYDWRW